MDAATRIEVMPAKTLKIVNPSPNALWLIGILLNI